MARDARTFRRCWAFLPEAVHHVRGRSENWKLVCVPAGTVEDIPGRWGIRMHANSNRHADPGASLATQSGLLFFAGTQDFYLRAFDTANGKEI